jgi:hypothetical protein
MTTFEEMEALARSLLRRAHDASRLGDGAGRKVEIMTNLTNRETTEALRFAARRVAWAPPARNNAPGGRRESEATAGSQTDPRRGPQSRGATDYRQVEPLASRVSAAA